MLPPKHAKNPLPLPSDAIGTHGARLPLILLITTLAGCAAAGPDYKPMLAAAPSGWSAWHGGSPALSTTHQQNGSVSTLAALFDDRVLDALEAKALLANHDLLTAALRFAQSRTQRVTVAAQRGLQVDASASLKRQRESENGAETRLLNEIAPTSELNQLVSALSSPSNLYDAGFDASWELDLWGRVRRSIEAADANVDAAAATLRAVQLDVSTELARNYFELRDAQQQLRLTRVDIAAAEESLALIRAKADGGLNNDLDVNRQRAQLADMRSLLPGLLEQEAQASNQLTLLTGLQPGALQQELAPRMESEQAPVLPDLRLGLPSEFALRRPDIQGAQARLHAATANIGIATADAYPRLTLGASFGLESVRGSNFGDWGSRQWSLGPSLSMPIFDHGRRLATIQLRTLEQQEAAISFQQTVLKAWHEIDSALTSYTAQRQRQQQLAEKERSSRAAYVLARVRYRHGLTDYLVELDAWRTLLQAQRDDAQSTSLLSIRLVSIYKALGGAAPDN